MRVLIATRTPERFQGWISALEGAGFQVSVAAPEVRTQGRAWRDLPDVTLLDLVEAGSAPEDVRRLLEWSGLLPGAGVIAVVPEHCLAKLALEEVDDVVPAPASFGEVVYRVRRVAGRRTRNGPAVAAGDLLIGPGDGPVLLSGERIELRGRELQLLRFLAARPNRVFRREELAREVWGPQFRSSLRTVDTHIHRLRSRLGRFGRQRIQTVRGVGYRFHAPLQPTPPGR